MDAESGEPRGEYAVKWMSLSAQYSASLRWGQKGWHSTWHTEMGCLAYALMASILAAEKLETPMERTRPSSTSASIASHVSLMDGLSASPTHPVTTGQWIRYRSR